MCGSVYESTIGGINNGCHLFVFIRGKSLRKHSPHFTVFFTFCIFFFNQIITNFLTVNFDVLKTVIRVFLGNVDEFCLCHGVTH